MNEELPPGNAGTDTLAKQQAQMTDMLKPCETRTDAFRCAWFTGRWNNA